MRIYVSFLALRWQDLEAEVLFIDTRGSKCWACGTGLDSSEPGREGRWG